MRFLSVIVFFGLVIPAGWSGCGNGSGNVVQGDFSVDTYPQLTNQSPYSFSGQKPEGQAVQVDGSELVAASVDTSWELALELSEGGNSFTFESVDAEGTVFKSEDVEIALDSLAPAVVTQLPAPDATDVALNTLVSVTLSEPVECATVTSQTFLIQGVSAVLSCDLTSQTLSLVPQANLAPATTYTVSLYSDVRDLAGNRLANDVGWQFTTGTTIDDIPPDPPTADSPAPPGTTVLDQATVGGWKESESSVISNGTEIVAKNDLDSWSYGFAFGMGENTFSLTSEDAAGNVSVTSTDFSVTRSSGEFTVDAYPPLTNQTPFDFGGTKSSGYAVWVDGTEEVSPGPETTWQYQAGLSEGQNTFLFEAQDSGGSTVASLPASITLDTQAPQIVGRSPAPGAPDVNPLPTITVTFNEPVDCATVNNQSFSIQSVSATVKLYLWRSDRHPGAGFQPGGGSDLPGDRGRHGGRPGRKPLGIGRQLELHHPGGLARPPA